MITDGIPSPYVVEVLILSGLRTQAICKKVTGAHPDDFERVRKTAWRGRIVGGARKNRADSIRDYNILVLYVNDNFKWFRQNEIARDG